MTGRVAVRPSRLPGAGVGLFALRPFRRGALITAYDGELVDHAEAAARRRAGRGAYLRTLSRGRLHIDRWSGAAAPPHPLGLAMFANDADGPGRVPGVENNAEWHTVHLVDGLVPVAVLRAKRDIHENTEICVSYGKRYWMSGGRPPPTPPAAT